MRLPILILVFLVFVTVGYFAWEYQSRERVFTAITSEEKEKPLEKYAFDTLAQRKFESSEIELGEVVEENRDYTSRLFFFRDGDKQVSGQIHIPEGERIFSVIVMFRGYVDREIYATGIGTQRAAEVYAASGFVTIAPDFLGYGQSDDPSENTMEERFQTYTSAITLLRSIENLNDVFESEEIDARVDVNKVGVWGHSNGGQIAISVLEITQESIPTVLWAPVSKPFPYSILYYTDEFDDRGKYLRRVIAEFEQDYDVEDYSIEKFYERINAPIQVYQGGKDDSVPQKWSEEFVENLEDLDKDIDYFLFSGADHNLLPNGWNRAVSGGMEFYREHFK